MFGTDWFNNINRSDILPPLHVRKKVRDSKEWKMAVLDAFEFIAQEQFMENIHFSDYYRMVDGKMSYQELSQVIPQLKGMQDLLDGVGIPTFLKHYDIIGIIVNALVGKFIDMQDKFHVIDVGEVAESEFLRYKDQEIQKMIAEIIENEVTAHLAEQGLSPEGKKFTSQEEQQQYMAQVAAVREKYTSAETKRDSEKSYKTLGVKWGEATLEKDKEDFDMATMEKNEFKDYILTGRCFREYKIANDRYYPETWSPKNTFFSKELNANKVQDLAYAGRLHFYTPSEIIRKYGHKLSPVQTREILGGNENWKSFVGNGVVTGSIGSAINNNFVGIQRVPFEGYHDYNFLLGLQDETGIPMGISTEIGKDGTQKTGDRFLPRMMGDNFGRYNNYARIMRDDFSPRMDLCQTTEVYFIAYKLFGYLTYENEFGRIVTEEVTEEILPDFLKENNIKQTYKESISDRVGEFKVNTLQWVYSETTYEGVKIQSQNLADPIYLYCDEMEYQIPGASPFHRKLPVAGFIGKSTAAKIMPFQAKYNLCMNQMYSLLEKEIGIFFLMDITLIPSEYEDFGDTEEALIHLRNIAKDTGIMPVTTSGDRQKNNNTFNQFSTYDISFTKQIQSRIQIAGFCQRKAYEAIGINPSIQAQPSKYETAEGVRVSNEAGFAQISEIYADFSSYNKGAHNLHLACAQYAQSNGKDISLYYTKSDASIQYLKMSDPEFPLRNIGVIASSDSRKRKELETFKNLLINTNTLGSNTVELAKLIASDSMQEMIEIARLEQKNKDEREKVKFERDQQLVQQQGEQLKQAEEIRYQREVEKTDKTIEKDLIVAQLNAVGRAADKQSDSQSYDAINKVAEQGIKNLDVQRKIEKDSNDFRLNEKKHNDSIALKMQELALKAKELSEKSKARVSQEYVATINKN